MGCRSQDGSETRRVARPGLRWTFTEEGNELVDHLLDLIGVVVQAHVRGARNFVEFLRGGHLLVEGLGGDSGVGVFTANLYQKMHIGMHEIANLQGLGDFMEELDLEQVKLGGYPNQAMSAHHYAANVKVPMLITQVKEDMWSRTDEDVQVTYDLLTLPEEDKKLFWIEGTTQRFDGYNYFSEHPGMMIEWFDKYMK